MRRAYVSLKMFDMPRVTRKICLAFLAVFFAALSCPVQAQEARQPAKLLTPFPPGAATDALSKPLAQALGKRWGSAVEIVHRPGNNTVTATQEIKSSPGDGRTLLLSSQTVVTAPFLVANVGYDPLTDLAPISLIAKAPVIVIVAPNSPFRSVADVIAAAQKEPGKLRYASSGLGTSFHLAAELFQKAANIRFTHIQLGGGAEAIAALLSGNVEVVFSNSSGAFGAIGNGTVRALAVATPSRWPLLPELPTVGDTLPGFEAFAWFALFAPTSTTEEVLERIRADVRDALADPEVVAAIAKSGGEPKSSTAPELKQLLIDDQLRWGGIIRELGLLKP